MHQTREIAIPRGGFHVGGNGSAERLSHLPGLGGGDTAGVTKCRQGDSKNLCSLLGCGLSSMSGSSQHIRRVFSKY